MNFKDVYKSSNDCIKADRKLLEDIFKKSEKPAWFNYGRQIISCAAVLICFVTGALFLKQSSPAVPDTNTVYTDPVQKNETVIVQADNGKPELQSEDSATENSVNKSADNILPEKSAVEVPQAKFDIATDTETFSLPRMASGGGSGGSGAACDNISLEEYSDYVGIDFLSISPKLPEGMYVALPSEIIFEKNVQTGDILNDYVQFVALDNDNPNRIMTIELTKSDGDISEFFALNSDNMITIDNYNVVVTAEEKTLKSCFKHNDLWISITSIDVSSEEFDTFLNTLLKKEN